VIATWPEQKPSSSPPDPLQRIAHTASLESGYSGGPLFDATGRLVAVNARAGDRILLTTGQWLPVSLAIRPDRQFLARLIRDDAPPKITK
jgi:hypothetical protein